MKYLRLEKGVVAEIIPEFNPLFPSVPVAERYPADFIKSLIRSEAEVSVGMHRTADGSFEFPKKYSAETKTLSEIKNSKLKELSANCNQKIIDGFELNGSHYSMTITDQLNMSTLYNELAIGKESVFYHADNEPVKIYSKDDFMVVYTTGQLHKNKETVYFNLLKQYVNSLSERETIEKIYYGQPLTGEYLSAYQEMINSL